MSGSSARWAGVALTGLMLAGCGGGDGGPGSAPIGPRRPGIDLDAIDRGVQPCGDFFQFACGRWLARHPLTASSSFTSTNLDPFYAQVGPLTSIIEDAAAGPVDAQSPETRLIGSYYRACLAAPGQPEARQRLVQLARTVDAIASLEDLARVAGAFGKLGSAGFLWMYVDVDPGNAARYTLTVDAGGRELPDRRYYLEPQFEGIRQRYLKHIAALAALVGVAVDPAAVLAIETELATADLPRSARRDPRALHHPMALEEMEKLAPRFPWRAYLEGRGITGGDRVNVILPPYLAALDDLLGRRTLEQLKSYLRWQIVEDKASFLDQQLLDEQFSFHDRVFFGVSRPQPRDWTCYLRTTSGLGFLLARTYVERYFDPKTREDGRMLIQQVRLAMRRRLEALAWLDEPTRSEAFIKLEKVAEKIGYPDTWPTFDLINPGGTWLDLQLATSEKYYAWNLARLPQPVDRTEWFMAPIEVNAYYAAPLNEIVFPAAIFRLPYFDPASGAAANFGAIGSVMGHELTHGFDDEGRQFDGDGNLRNWWSPSVEAAFTERARCVVDQFSRQEPLPGQHVDGALTLGENLADLGGLNLAFDAWKASGQEPARMAEFDGAQQFFIAYAQTHCTQLTPELLSTWLATDPHAPPKARVNVPLSQLETFAQAFQCPAGVPLRVRPACEVW